MKIEMPVNNQTIAQSIENFLFTRKAKGNADKTIQSYHYQFQAIAKYLDTQLPIAQAEQAIPQMTVKMRDTLSDNTIHTYTKALRVLLNWAAESGYYQKPSFALYHAAEATKDVYTDAELHKLLKKPNMRNCLFAEYRNWVIVNFLVNCGCRASTIRNILIKDVDMDNNAVLYRHTKAGKVQIIPLCADILVILKEYLSIRKGDKDDFLFCNDMGQPLTESCLRKNIARYNSSRGVCKTSIHLFRHTFAKKFLLDCGGDAFRLQKLLGHSTMDMTKHYCNLYDADLLKGFDDFSPLAQLNKAKGKYIALK